MPKNKGKGGKAHRRGAKGGDATKRELVFKQDLEDYCVVTATLGDGRFEMRDTSEKKRVGRVRGKMFKKVWITVGDLVLVSLREYQDDKCDIVYKYEADEVRELKAYGEIKDDGKERNKDEVIFESGGSESPPVHECAHSDVEEDTEESEDD